VLRADKVKVVEGLAESFGRKPHIFLTKFSGLTVNQSTELRRKVREAGGSFRVIKNRLAKRASGDTGIARIIDMLAGPCARASHESDPAALAKVLTDFSKNNPQLEIVAGVVDDQHVVDPAGVKRLAVLPSLPELRAQLLAMILSPATSLVRLLNTPAGKIARALDARKEKIAEG
jgi:large subunit ribosomal protein L10